MSSTLCWRVVVPVEVETLPYQLKKKLGPRLWDHDGSVGGDDRLVGPEMKPYLEGLRDAGVTGADELLAHIEKYGAVVIWIEP
jgi:hypothetical protein